MSITCGLYPYFNVRDWLEEMLSVLGADRISGPVRYPVDFDPIRSGPVLPLNFTESPDQENENFQFQTLKFSILKS